MHTFDCIVVGGGQSGLATGYYLRRKKLDFTILDANPVPVSYTHLTLPTICSV